MGKGHRVEPSKQGASSSYSSHLIRMEAGSAQGHSETRALQAPPPQPFFLWVWVCWESSGEPCHLPRPGVPCRSLPPLLFNSVLFGDSLKLAAPSTLTWQTGFRS